ncbi:hypothetical protein WA158_005706 [Blastocystis sp. Blastoise]
MKFLNVALLAGLLLGVSAIIPYPCSHTFKDPDERFPLSAKFDLSPLHTDSQWSVKDSSASTRNFTYVFNVCGPVRDVPKPLGGTGVACTNTEQPQEVVPAYQVSEWSDSCYRLSSTSIDDVEWRLLDNNDPTNGLVYSYYNGDGRYCSEGRKFELHLYCHDDAFNVPDEETVQETNCVYILQLQSIFGCPLECSVSKNRLCGGNGVCRFDTDTRKSHCYCNTGYKGYACDPAEPLKMNTTTIILCVVSAFLVIVEIGIFIMWKKVKSLRLDPAAYALNATDNV